MDKPSAPSNRDVADVLVRIRQRLRHDGTCSLDELTAFGCAIERLRDVDTYLGSAGVTHTQNYSTNREAWDFSVPEANRADDLLSRLMWRVEILERKVRALAARPNRGRQGA